MSRITVTSAIVLLAGTVLSSSATAQQNAPAPLHQPRGTAVDVSNAEILAAIAKATATAQPFSNQTLRMVNVNGEYNLGVSVLYRAKADAATLEAPLEHSQITEVYYMISGNGTFVTGGRLRMSAMLLDLPSGRVQLAASSSVARAAQSGQEMSSSSRRTHLISLVRSPPTISSICSSASIPTKS